jgi:hypothetical protein
MGARPRSELKSRPLFNHSERSKLNTCLKNRNVKAINAARKSLKSI